MVVAENFVAPVEVRKCEADGEAFPSDANNLKDTGVAKLFKDERVVRINGGLRRVRLDALYVVGFRRS